MMSNETAKRMREARDLIRKAKLDSDLAEAVERRKRDGQMRLLKVLAICAGTIAIYLAFWLWRSL